MAATAMNKIVDSFEYTDIAGHKLEYVLKNDQGRWTVDAFQDDEWMWSVTHNPQLGVGNPRSRQPFNEEEARAEFERWRPS
jgi:hypothetical protein